MRTSIADRYILQEIFAPFLLGVGAFLVILVGDILYTLAEFIASRQVGAGTIVELLIYKLPAILVITFPVSTLVGIVLGLGRLAKDREIQAMRLAGFSLMRIFVPVFAFGLVTTVATFAINEIVAPWANRRANAVIRRAAFADAFPQIREQVFFRGPGNRVYYIGSADDAHRELRNVTIYELEGPVPRLITAGVARWEGEVGHLYGGVVRELDEQGFTHYEAGFAKMELVVVVGGRSVGSTHCWRHGRPTCATGWPASRCGLMRMAGYCSAGRSGPRRMSHRSLVLTVAGGALAIGLAVGLMLNRPNAVEQTPAQFPAISLYQASIFLRHHGQKQAELHSERVEVSR